jgi:hypothetical protein
VVSVAKAHPEAKAGYDIRTTAPRPSERRQPLGNEALTPESRPFRASVNRELESTCKAGTDAPSSGEFLTLPEHTRSTSRARPPAIHHRSHLGAVSCPLARARDRPSPRLPQTAHPRQGGLREAGTQVLVFGCAYERIADESCSESTLRRGRDEWIELGLMERLREISLDA